MKRILSTILICILGQVCTAQQNIVGNGDFEQYTTCPSGYGQYSNSTGWSSWNLSGTPDYYNVCYTGMGGPGVPVSTVGYQVPASGNAYMGLFSYSNADVKEYITRPIPALQIGYVYEFSMSVSLANFSGGGTNDISVFFYDNLPTVFSGIAIPAINSTQLVPKLDWSTTVITDTQNWVRITKKFVADSAYDNIAIGGYMLPTAITYTPVNSAINGMSYYLIDSVVLFHVDSLYVNYFDTLKCAGDTIKVPYICAKKKLSNNIFTLQLSNSSGSFASPVNLGTIASDTSGIFTVVIPANTATGTGYKLRVVTSSFADTSEQTIAIKIGGGIVKPDANNNGPVCTNAVLALTATTSTIGATWSWTGPNSFTSSLQNPTLNNPPLTNGGDYIVTARLHGCVSRDTTNAIILNGVSSSSVLATANAPVCEYDTIKLYSKTVNSSFSYSWTGPNGFASNLQNPVLPVATPSTAGNYILTISNSSCSGKDTVTVQLTPYPTNVLAAYNGPLCSGNTINFYGSSSTSGVSWSWTGPNGFNATTATPSLGGSSTVHNGDYIVAASVNGCTTKDTVAVQIKPLPVKPIATVNGPVCATETLNFGATTSTGGVSWGWTGPGTYSSNNQNTTLNNSTTTMSGDYIVTISLDGCVNKDTVTATIKSMPQAVTVSGSAPRCAGDTVYLDMSNSTTGSTYSWAGPNSYSNNNQHTYIVNSTVAATGWYKGTVNLNGCLYKDSVNITVHPIPATPATSYNGPLCIGETLQLLATTISGVSYSWTGPNNYSSNIQNASRSNMQFADTGMYVVIATANGCTSSSAGTRVALNAQPFVVVTVNPGDSICAGQQASFTAYPNNHGGTPTYQWYVNGIATGGTGTAYNSTTLNHMDIVHCKMTENTKCSVPYTDASNDVEMKVLLWLAPSVSISASTTQPLKENEYITFTATPINAGAIPKYQWKRNGQNIVGATGFAWGANTLDDNDEICVEVISTYKCPQPLSAKSNCIKVKVLGGVNNITGEGHQLMLYPNPNNGTFTISGKVNTNEKLVINIVNALGQVVYTQEAEPRNGQLNEQIQTQALAAGVYMLRLHNEALNLDMKFRIQ